MFRIFIYRFKSLIKNRTLIFWLAVFPIVLVSFFNLAFSNIDSSNLFKTFEVGVVGDKNAPVVDVMKEVKYDENKIFSLKFVDEEKGRELLDDKEIKGLIIIENNEELSLVVNDNSTNQLILQEFLNNYKQKSELIEKEISENPNLYLSDWISSLDFDKDNVLNKEISEKVNNQMILSFYSVIAMSCMYGSFLSSESIISIQPNLSKQGARVNVSPYKKLKLLICDYIVCLIIVLFSLTLLVLYMNYIIRIEFSDQIWYIAIIIFVGALFSTAFGYMISLLLNKRSEAIRIGVIISITMLASFLAGMQGPEIKYIIESNAPFAKYLNPVSLLTDSFYTIYYYDDFNMIVPYLLILLGMSGLCLLIATSRLRRDSYDSI